MFDWYSYRQPIDECFYLSIGNALQKYHTVILEVDIVKISMALKI